MDTDIRRTFLKEIESLRDAGYLKDEQLEAIREKYSAEAAEKPEAPEKLATMARATMALLSVGVIAFVLAAIFFVSMGWMYMSSLVRVLVVGGFTGAAYAAAFSVFYRTAYKKSAGALLVLASILLAVFLAILSSEFDLALGTGTPGTSLFILSILSIAYVCTAYLMPSNAVALLACGSLTGVYAVLMFQPATLHTSFLGISGLYRWLLLAVFFLVAGWAHQKYKNNGYANILYIAGSLVLFGSSMAISGETDSEFLWQAILVIECVLLVGLSIPLKSRALLVMGVLFSIVDIIQLYAEYFTDVLWWPIGLAILGAVLIAAALLLERNRAKVKAVLGNWS